MPSKRTDIKKITKINKKTCAGVQVTSRGGYLVASFLLPLSHEHWAHSLVRDPPAAVSFI